MASNYPPGMSSGHQGFGIAELECPGCHTKFGILMEYELGGGWPVGDSEDVAVECLMCGHDLGEVPAGTPSVPVPQDSPHPDPWGPDPDTGEVAEVTDDLTYVAFADGAVLPWAGFEELAALCVARGGRGFVPGPEGR